MDDEKPIKVVILGESGVGKTSIISQYINGVASPHSTPTIGASFVNKKIKVSDESYSVDIWDTAGQEVYRSLAPTYYRNASAAIITFDVTSHESFRQVSPWLAQIRDYIPTIPIVLCGNKSDLASDIQVKTEQGKSWAAQRGYCFRPTSAVTGEGIQEIFMDLAEKLIQIQTVTGIKKNVIDEPATVDESKCKC